MPKFLDYVVLEAASTGNLTSQVKKFRRENGANWIPFGSPGAVSSSESHNATFFQALVQVEEEGA